MAELRIGCLVMAAGSGSRFGRNKLEAVVDGKSLLRRSLEAVPAEEFAQVTVVTQYDAAAALAEEFGFTVVRNDRPEDGLSRTVRLGTEAMAGCGAILYQVADQPLLEQETVRRELEYFRTHPDHIVGLAHNGVRGSPRRTRKFVSPTVPAVTVAGSSTISTACGAVRIKLSLWMFISLAARQRLPPRCTALQWRSACWSRKFTPVGRVNWMNNRRRSCMVIWCSRCA